MKHYFIALPLLALSASALANTATIQFRGVVEAGSCPIVIKDPAGGTPGTVEMGDAMAGNFGASGAEANHRTFIIEVADPENCPNWGAGNQQATVQFFGLSGGAGNDTLFALKPSPTGAATGVALGIKDKDGKLVGDGDTSGVYPLTAGQKNELMFTAFYKSTEATVTAGEANADVAVELSIN